MKDVEVAPGLVLLASLGRSGGQRQLGRFAPLALTVAILAVSTAAIMVRLSTAPPLPVAFWRLAFATLLLAPPTLAWHRADLQALTPREIGTLALVGVVLGVHFATWIASLYLTTVAASVVLVTTHPVLVGLGSGRLLGEPLTGRGWFGVLLALAGAAVIVAVDRGLGVGNLLGDALALTGAAAMAVYLLAGRHVRQRLPVLPYVLVVYGSATVSLGLATLVSGQPFTGYPLQDWLLFLGLAVVPMILGHTLLNWSLEHLPAPVVSTTILGEPLGSTVLAWLILSEVPPTGTLLGGAVVLAGILLVARQGVTAPDGGVAT